MRTTLAAIIAIFGFVLAGSEATTITQQFISCTIGLVMLAGGGWWIAEINREGK